MAAEQKTLSGQVDDLLSWLKDTEAQMDGGMRAEENNHGDQLTQQLNLCKVCVDRDIKSYYVLASLSPESQPHHSWSVSKREEKM